MSRKLSFSEHGLPSSLPRPFFVCTGAKATFCLHVHELLPKICGTFNHSYLSLNPIFWYYLSKKISRVERTHKLVSN